MSDIKQLLEKANRKCEMRWRVFAYDPEQDNKLVHTSKDAFDCIKMAGEYKMDLAKKNPNYIIEIIAESKEQRNEAYKVGDKVRVTSKGTFGYGNTGIIRAINGDKFTIDFNAPNSGTIKLSAKDIIKESAQKNEVSYSSLEKFFKQKQKEVDSTAKKLEILKAKLEKAKNLLSKAKDRAVVVFYGGFDNVPLIAYAESFNDLKDAEELFSKIKSQSAASSYATSKGSIVSPIEAIELLYYQKTKEIVFFDKDFEKLYKSGFSSESSQKNEEKEFTIKLVTPFGKAKVCSWKANSVDAAVKEFLDANPAYRENKKGAVIAESTQQSESLGDEIVQEVKEEVKDGVKDLVQQDVDAKLNGEITPKDYQQNFEEIDDDSDGIFGDELANAEPDEPEQTNESTRKNEGYDAAEVYKIINSKYGEDTWEKLHRMQI